MKGSQGLDALAELCGASSQQVKLEEAASAPSPSTIAAAATSSKPEAPRVTQPPILPKATPQPTVSQQNVAQLPWQQAIAAGAAGNMTNTTAAQTMALLQQAAALQSVGATDPASMNAMQQLAYIQYAQFAQAAALQAQMGGATTTVPQVAMDASKVPVIFPGQAPQPASQTDASNIMASQQQQQKVAPTTQSKSATLNSMQPPLPPSQVPASKTSVSIPTPRPKKAKSKITKPTPMSPTLPAEQPESSADKKLLKRAANRRSAQLSRKRKKLFIEELKEENDELRRKEQILKSIPDLIVVFDSSGKIWFVSHSVSRFLDFSSRELEGASFWDRLCNDSMRLLKAAFMDALAARTGDVDSTPLGSGVWELRLVDKDGSHKIVALNGVVHFTNDSPECVCTIRPRDEVPISLQEEAQALPTHRNVSLSSGDNNSSSSSRPSSSNSFVRHSIKPQQSVVSSQDARMKVNHQISDSGSCCISESGSDE